MRVRLLDDKPVITIETIDLSFAERDTIKTIVASKLIKMQKSLRGSKSTKSLRDLLSLKIPIRPKFIYFEDTVSTPKTVEYIEKYISQISDIILDEVLISTIEMIYGNLNRNDIIALWCIFNNYKDLSFKNVKYDYSALENAGIDSYTTEMLIKKYSVQGNTVKYAKTVKIYKEYLSSIERIHSKIPQTQKPTVISEMHVKEIQLNFIVSFGESGSSTTTTPQSLIKIFDCLIANDNIPFIVFKSGKLFISKVYSNTIPDGKWVLESEYAPDGLFLVIKIQKNYISIMWNPRGTCTSTIKENYPINFKKDMYDILRVSVVENAVGDIQVSDVYTRYINGIFTISSEKFMDVKIRPEILADLIWFGDYAKNTMYFNEDEKSFSTKEYPHLYCKQFNVYSVKDSISASLIRVKTPLNTFQITVRRCSNQRDLGLFQQFMNRLLDEYILKENTIVEKYKRFMNVDTSSTQPSIKQEKINKKTKKSLDDLQAHNKELFAAGYATVCQPTSHQPILVKPDEASNIPTREKLTFEGDTYTCGESVDGRKLFPGLKANKKTEFKDRYPQVPCCFLKVQNTDTSRFNKDVFSKISPTEHIFMAEKSVLPERLGKLALNLINIFKEFYPDNSQSNNIYRGEIFRFGVLERNDSFIHAILRVVLLKYSNEDTIAGKIRIVENFKRELANNRDLYNSSLQNLWNISFEEYSSLLRDNDSYIPPELFIRALEIATKRNIILFTTDPVNPNGNFLFEKSHGVFVDYPEKFKKTILILRNYSHETEKFQCEILVRYISANKNKNKTKNKNKYSFDFDTDSDLIKKLEKYKHLAYRTYKI